MDSMEGKTMEKLGAAIVLLEQTRKKLQAALIALDKAKAAYSDALVVMQEHGLDEEVSYLRSRWPEVEIVDYGISTFTPEEPICPGCKRPVSECRAEDVDEVPEPWVARLVDARFNQSETTRFEMLTLAGATPDEAITALIDQRRKHGSQAVTTTE